LSDNRIDDQGFGFKLLGAVDLGDRLVESTHRAQILGVPLMGRGIVWFELKGSLELALGARPVPLFEFNPGKRVVRLSKRVVKLQRSGSRFLYFGESYFRLDPIEAAQNVVAISQSRIGQRVTGVQINRLLKIFSQHDSPDGGAKAPACPGQIAVSSLGSVPVWFKTLNCVFKDCFNLLSSDTGKP
jgi:hypothetical protein